MLRRIVQNAVGEFSMGYAKRVEISVDVVSNSITVTDDGAGIPKRMLPSIWSFYDMPGMYPADYEYEPTRGVRLVLANSRCLKLVNCRDGFVQTAVYENGKLVSENVDAKAEYHGNGLSVCFAPLDDVWQIKPSDRESIEALVNEFVSRNAVLKIEVQFRMT